MAEYRAIKTSMSRWSWTIQRKVWFFWTSIECGFNEDEVRAALEFYAGHPQVIYPSDLRKRVDPEQVAKAVDPLGLRNDTQ